MSDRKNLAVKAARAVVQYWPSPGPAWTPKDGVGRIRMVDGGMVPFWARNFTWGPWVEVVESNVRVGLRRFGVIRT